MGKTNKCLSFLDACTLHYFGKLLSFLHYGRISFFDQISTKNFDRCPFEELSFDENSTNGHVRRDVRFD